MENSTFQKDVCIDGVFLPLMDTGFGFLISSYVVFAIVVVREILRKFLGYGIVGEALSSPVILIMMIELFGNNFISGKIGLELMFATSAFGFLNAGVCIACVIRPRRVENYLLFWINVMWNVWAHVWICVAVEYNSPDQVTFGEALVMLGCVPFVVASQYICKIPKLTNDTIYLESGRRKPTPDSIEQKCNNKFASLITEKKIAVGTVQFLQDFFIVDRGAKTAAITITRGPASFCSRCRLSTKKDQLLETFDEEVLFEDFETEKIVNVSFENLPIRLSLSPIVNSKIGEVNKCIVNTDYSELSVFENLKRKFNRLRLITLPWSLVSLLPKILGCIVSWTIIVFLVVVLYDSVSIFSCVADIPEKFSCQFLAVAFCLADVVANVAKTKRLFAADWIQHANLNVFFGVGTTWAIGSIYWREKSMNLDRTVPFIVDSKNTFYSGFYIVLFVTTIVMLTCKRKFDEGEVGGTFRKFTALIFVSIWAVYNSFTFFY